MKYYGSSHHFLDILNYASSSSSSHGEDDVTLRCKDGQSLQTSSLLIFLLKSEDNMIRRALLTHHDPMDPMDPITIHFPDFTQSTLKSLIQLLSQGITTCQSQSQIEDIIEIGHIFGIYNINLKDDDHNDIQQQIKDEIQDDNDENDDDYDDYENAPSLNPRKQGYPGFGFTRSGPFAYPKKLEKLKKLQRFRNFVQMSNL